MVNKRTKEIIDKHVKDKNIISVLQSIQNKFGYIPEEEAKYLSKKLEIPLVKVYGIITFYNQFKLQQTGKYVFRICAGTACHVNNSKELIDHFKEKLEIDEGETTKDGIFTLEIVTCIGACARSPAIMLNGEVHGRMTKEKLNKLIKEIKMQGGLQ